MKNAYTVDGVGFGSFFAAIDAAQKSSSVVIETATGLVRWSPAPKRAAKVRHVLVNADGSTTVFSKVRR